jgi:hypothetical protein
MALLVAAGFFCLLYRIEADLRYRWNWEILQYLFRYGGGGGGGFVCH